MVIVFVIINSQCLTIVIVLFSLLLMPSIHKKQLSKMFGDVCMHVCMYEWMYVCTVYLENFAVKKTV